MATYPTRYARLTNFLRAQLAGQAFDPSKLDAELNAIAEAFDQLNTRHRNITTASGQLKNVAAATAATLLGRQRFAATAGQTVFTTTLAYDATVTLDAFSGGAMIDPDLVTVSDVGGFISATLPAQAASTVVVLDVWTTGAGVLALLDSNANGEGASLVGVEDAAGLYTSDTAEGCLAEIRQAFDDFEAALGPIGDLLKRDGSVALTGDLDANGNTVTGLKDGSAASDAVNMGQIAAYVAIWNNLQQYYLKRDGSVAMAGNLNMGSKRITSLGDPINDTDGVNKRSISRILAQSGSIPIGVPTPYLGDVAPSGWLLCDGACYATSAYPTLSALLPTSLLSGPTQGCRAAKFAAIQAGNLTAGVLTSLPTLDGGVGYWSDPEITVENTDGGAAVTSQPTFDISRTDYTLNGAIVSGGTISVAITAGGTGIRAGAIIRIRNVTGSSSALVQIPNGYFRVPDLRGRIIVGAGTESKTPGIIDPPSEEKGDDYDATTHAIGSYGGEEKHLQTVDELASHRHTLNTSWDGYDRTYVRMGNTGDVPATGYGAVGYEGGDQPFPLLQPYFVANYIVKAL
jgi:microcystin-dependent protein